MDKLIFLALTLIILSIAGAIIAVNEAGRNMKQIYDDEEKDSGKK